ncbi:hypothetical protein T484DRAFT_1747609 [Baffinella frigidus]|nr:hypothetical protein T484DRAFT_1747609 [Cryptophyta sp. CCMP2293]
MTKPRKSREPDPPPTNWRDKLDEKTRTLQWKHAAGFEAGGVTYKKPKAHKNARARVWDLEKARLAKDKLPRDRNETEIDDILKVDHPGEYRKLRSKGVGRDELIPPPAGWRNDLDEDERAELWRYAAGLNDDDTSKTASAHSDARRDIRWKDKVDAAKQTNPGERTLEEINTILEDIKRKAGSVDRSRANRMIIAAEKMEAALLWAALKGLPVANQAPLSETDACNIVFKLFDDRDSILFDALGGKTLREACWNGNSTDAIYVLASRGMGDVGASSAEGIRFLVNNTGNKTTVLTKMDGDDFKYSNKEFKKLDLVYCPVYMSNSFADCTAVELVFQLLLNFLEIGSRRLWLQSNVGRYHRPLRTCDMQYIDRLETEGNHEDAKNIKFVCGITILKNVSVLERKTDPVTGKDVVASIKTGSGTTCMVHQPLKNPLYSSEAQKSALSVLRTKLGLNFIDRNRKRKAATLSDTSAAHEDDSDDDFQVREFDDAEYDSDDE